jgi:hypothetical protein
MGSSFGGGRSFFGSLELLPSVGVDLAEREFGVSGALCGVMAPARDEYDGVCGEMGGAGVRAGGDGSGVSGARAADRTAPAPGVCGGGGDGDGLIAAAATGDAAAPNRALPSTLTTPAPAIRRHSFSLRSFSLLSRSASVCAFFFTNANTAERRVRPLPLWRGGGTNGHEPAAESKYRRGRVDRCVCGSGAKLLVCEL